MTILLFSGLIFGTSETTNLLDPRQEQRSHMIQITNQEPRTTEELNAWYEFHHLYQNTCRQTVLTHLLSETVGLLSSGVLIYLAYDFGANEPLHRGVGMGAVTAVLAAPSPVLGFCRINNNYISQWTRMADEPVFSSLFHDKSFQKILRTIFTLANATAVIPYVYTAHFASQKLFNNLPVSILLDVATLFSNMLVYDMASEKIVEKITMGCTTSPERKYVYDYLRQLKDWYSQLSSKNTLQLAEHAVSIQSATNAVDENSIDSRIVKLIKPDDFVYNSQHQTFLKTKLAHFCGGLSFLGSYYLAVVGRDDTFNLLQSSVCESVGKHNVLLPTTCYSTFNHTNTTVSRTQDYDLLPALAVSYVHQALIFLMTGMFSYYSAFSTISNFSVQNVNKCIIPLVGFFALTRTMPNIELAVDFLGLEWYWICLSVCTALNIFTSSAWALNVFFDGFFQTEAQKNRASLVGKTERLIQAVPKFSTSTVKTLHKLITSTEKSSDPVAYLSGLINSVTSGNFDPSS